MLEFLGCRLPVADGIEGRYIEPFLGAGSVFFLLNPDHALLSDINPDLIDLYRGLRRSPQMVWDIYCSFGRRKADYRKVRDSGPQGRLAERAARVLFLNRTCFKGMWRHNRKGNFNVGYGGQSRRWVIDRDDLMAVGRALRQVKIRCCDFEETVDKSVAGDFLFLDPPYRPGARDQRHDHYVGHRFTFDDHRRLAAALRRAKERGVDWAMTTSAHPDIVKLFRGKCIAVLPRGTGRQPGVMLDHSGEVLITTYLMKGESIL